MADLSTVESLLGYRFQNQKHLLRALTHSSLPNERPAENMTSNSRLAHLGDAVVELAVREALFHADPRQRKGELSIARSKVVNNEALARAARDLKLGDFLQRGGSLSTADNTKALAEALEAVMGAIFVDAGYEAAAKVVVKRVPLPSPK